MVWQSCARDNWDHPDYCKPTGSSIKCLRDQAPQDHIGAMDTIIVIVAPNQEAILMTVMITEIETASQLLVTSEARTIMPNNETVLGPILIPDPVLMVQDILLVITDFTFIMTRIGMTKECRILPLKQSLLWLWAT